VEMWRQHYNSERPHGALGNLTPMEYAMAGGRHHKLKSHKTLTIVGTEGQAQCR
jgi:hypothetical protein